MCERVTSAGCSSICSAEYLIDSVHTYSSTHILTHTHTQTQSFVIFHVAVTQQKQSEDVVARHRKEDECVPVSVTARCGRWGGDLLRLNIALE